MQGINELGVVATPQICPTSKSDTFNVSSPRGNCRAEDLAVTLGAGPTPAGINIDSILLDVLGDLEGLNGLAFELFPCCR